MQASEAGLVDRCSDLQANVPGLTINEVDRAEFVLDERVVPPRVKTFARMTDMRVSPKIDPLVKFVRESVLPPVRAQPGFCGTVMRLEANSRRPPEPVPKGVPATEAGLRRNSALHPARTERPHSSHPNFEAQPRSIARIQVKNLLTQHQVRPDALVDAAGGFGLEPRSARRP
jgi:hypothetical protein